jgi:hypothetical protein
MLRIQKPIKPVENGDTTKRKGQEKTVVEMAWKNKSKKIF